MGRFKGPFVKVQWVKRKLLSGIHVSKVSELRRGIIIRVSDNMNFKNPK